MSSSIKLTGSLLVQLAEGAQPSSVPISFDTTYTEKVVYGFNYTSTQTNIAVPQGSVSNPRIVLVFVYEGAISVGWSSAGTGATDLTANPNPPPADRPVMMLFRYSPSSSTLYLTTVGAARGEIWLFE